MVSLGRARSLCYQPRLLQSDCPVVAPFLKNFRGYSKIGSKERDRNDRQNEFDYKEQENRMVAVAQW